MAYGKYKDLAKRTELEKFLKDKAFKIASNPKYDEYERGLALIIFKIFYKKSKLQQSIIKRFKRRRV